jgi:arsenate reductase
VLFLCTRNSARSQLAEALLRDRAGSALEVASAGADPAMSVDPMTFEVLDELGIDWRAHTPKGFDAVLTTPWDVVVTVCDHARDVCPVFPGHPVHAHWPIEDPSALHGYPAERRRKFLEVVERLRTHIAELVAALPHRPVASGPDTPLLWSSPFAALDTPSDAAASDGGRSPHISNRPDPDALRPHL